MNPPLIRPGWVRRLWNLLHRRDPWAGWTDVGYITEDGLELGIDDSLDDFTVPVTDFRKSPTIEPDFDPAKVSFSVDLEPSDALTRLFDPSPMEEIIAEVARRKNEAIETACRQALERECGVFVIMDTFQVYVSPFVPPGTIYYAPTSRFLEEL